MNRTLQNSVETLPFPLPGAPPMIRYLPAAVLLAAVVGCEKPQTQVLPAGMTAEQVADYRSKLLLDAEPSEAKTVIEVRDALKPSEEDAEDSDAAPTEVAVVGVIGGMPNPYGDAMPQFPWVDGQAIFSLADPTTAAEFEGEHAHAPGEECMFCAGKARDLVDTVALVTFPGDEDKPIAARSDLLLGLKPGTKVVVTGIGSVELGSLRIVANGVFVQPQ